MMMSRPPSFLTMVTCSAHSSLQCCQCSHKKHTKKHVVVNHCFQKYRWSAGLQCRSLHRLWDVGTVLSHSMGAVKASQEPIQVVDLLVELYNRVDIFSSGQSQVLCGVDFLYCNINLTVAVSCITFGHLVVVNEGVGRHTIGQSLDW
jgi:hypothetical protein